MPRIPVSIAQQATETPANLSAASSSIQNGFADASGLTPVLLFVVYALAFLVVAQFALPRLAKSRLVSKTGRRVLLSVHYALKGVGATIVIGLTAAPVYFVATAEPGTRGVAMRWLGYAVAGYAALVILGWLADRAVTRAIDAHPDYDSWGDIWPSDEEPESAEVAD